MKLLLLVSLLSSLSIASEDCGKIQVSQPENSKKIFWSHDQGSEKVLFVKNLDNGLVYPKQLVLTTSGSIYQNELEPNVKGYQLILAQVSDNVEIHVNNLITDCATTKKCSMLPKDVLLKKNKCNSLKSDIIK